MIMTQEEFVKKFCPDYEKKMELIESELVQSSNPVYHAAIEDSMFTEALQNFTYKICEAQKEICASGSSAYLNIDSRSYPNELIAIIIGAVHPNIEEL